MSIFFINYFTNKTLPSLKFFNDRRVVFLFFVSLLLIVTVNCRDSNASKIELTKKEQSFLSSHTEIILGSDTSWEPYIVKNSDGTISGFDSDILSIINQRTGANFRVEGGSWKNMVQKARNREIDGLSSSSANKERASFLNYTETYYTTSKALIVAKHNPSNVTSVKELSGLRVGYQNSNIFDKNIISRYKNVEIVPLDTLEEIVKALSTGKIDAAISAPFIYHALPGSASFIKTVDIFPQSSVDLVFAVRNDYPEAVSILNKGLASISQKEKFSITSKWFFQYEKFQQNTINLDLTAEEVNYLEGKNIITVGCLDSFAPFSFVIDGEPKGYSVEYLLVIGELLGKKVKFVHGPWSELLDILKSGELDIIPHIAVTEERRKFIDYTNFTHITYTTGIAIRKDNQVTTMDELKGKTVAVASNTFLHNHLSRNFPHINLLLVKSTSLAVEEVSAGRAFAVIGSLPTLNYHVQQDWRVNLKIVNIDGLDLPEKTTMPMGVTKGKTTLKSILEKAENSFPPEVQNRLKQKWMFTPVKDDHENSLTNRELEFIKQHPEIRFRVRPDRPPFEFERDGKAAGIVVDYLEAIAKWSGIEAKFIINDMPISQAYDMVENTRDVFDTLAFSVKSPARAGRFNFGDTFMSYPMMVIANKNSPYIGGLSDLNGKNVAIETGFLSNQWLNRDYPKINIIAAESTKDALRMVNDEKADAYVGNIGVANYMMIHSGMDNLKIVAPSDYGNIDYKFIAPKEWPELVTILSKGYRSLSPNFHSSLQQNWFTVQLVEKLDYTLIWKVLVIVALVVAWILWWNRKLHRAKSQTDLALYELRKAQTLLEQQNVKLEKLSITDMLTSLFNRMKLNGILEGEIERSKRYGSSFGVIMLDIDRFKIINDTHGHSVGDKVLITFAEILRENIRKVDIAGRWGGEEFLVICPETAEDGLVRIAENLKETIQDFDFGIESPVTASFGVTSYQNEDTEESLVSRADVGLYASKASGRNRVTLR